MSATEKFNVRHDSLHLNKELVPRKHNMSCESVYADVVNRGGVFELFDSIFDHFATKLQLWPLTQ